MTLDLKGEEPSWIRVGIVAHHPGELVALAHNSAAVPGIVVFLKLTSGFQLRVVRFLAAALLFVPLGSVLQLPDSSSYCSAAGLKILRE